VAALLVTAAAMAAGRSRGLSFQDMAPALGGVYLLLLGYFLLSVPTFQERLALRARTSQAFPFLAILILSLPYLIYSLPMHAFSAKGLGCLLLYLSAPVLLLGLKRGEVSPLLDFPALLLVWIPLELGLLPPLWPWPGQSGHSLDGLLGLLLAVVCFRGLRDLQGVGFTLIPATRDWRLAAQGTALFLPVALAIGLLTGFVRPSPHLPTLLPALGRVLGIYLITAVPEELLFRGILQNLLLRWTRRPVLSLALSAIIFGAAHWNVGWQADWRLLLLATLAGFLYGRLFEKAGGIMAPALAHTFINSIWILFFRA